MDKVLPFGLRSAPKIYSAVADAMQWILLRAGVDVIHYLDDFLLFGSEGPAQCGRALETALAMCARLGAPVASQKTEGPGSVLVFLGIELDTEGLVVRLQAEKLGRLQREIRKWGGKKACTKRELLSLIGQLQHACCVVKPGRSFLRRMIDLSKCARELHHRLRLNVGFRSDLQWWATFLPSWNGVGMMSGLVKGEPQVVLTLDASGSWGIGAYTSTWEWFQLELPESWRDVHITVKELIPIVIGVAIWGSKWKGAMVRCMCDNVAVVAVLNSGKCKMERVMHPMRCLFFCTARWSVTLMVQHIPGG